MSVLREVLDVWQKGIAAHAPSEVAGVFTEDAVFQGLRPYSVGRAGIALYYDGQPSGMTVDYEILESRQLADDVELGWVSATFTFPDGDRPPLPLNLTVVVRRTGDGWRISHYHVSHAPAG